MAWLKKQQPIQLYQGSDIPYIILDDGVRLCFDNCYGQHPNKMEHNINFFVHNNFPKRINTYFYKLDPFPITIPFSNVISLDNAIINGNTTAYNTEIQSGFSNLAIVQKEYVPKNSDMSISDLSDQLEFFDHSFILVGESIDSQIRQLGNVANIIHHKDWYRTLVSVIDKVCSVSDKRTRWTKCLPEILFSYYGTNKMGDVSKLNEVAEYIGLDANVEWVG